jgi:hypothetical protein
MPERRSASRSTSPANLMLGLSTYSSDVAAGQRRQRPALQFAFGGTIPVGNPLRARLSLTFALGLLSIGLTGCFRVSTDVGALRDSVTKAAQAEREERIEIGVGPLTLNLARAGLAFVDLEPEARTALHAVRSAEVGVYKLRGERRQLNHAAMLSAADKTMAGRGWDRVVGVINRHELVAIYVPGNARSSRNMKVCLVTVNDRELIVASARSNLEPVIELAWDRTHHHLRH